MSKRLLTAVLVMGATTWGGALLAETGSPTGPAQAYPPLGASAPSGPMPTSPSSHEGPLSRPSHTTTTMPVPATKPTSSNEDSPTAAVLGKLHHSNEKEIEMGKTAEKAGQAKDVRNFGKLLVKDHTAADKKVVALAKEEHIDLAASGSTSDHMPEPGADFDAKFSQMMLEDHTNDVNAVTAARDTTSDAKLKALLSELLPTLQKHKDIAQKLVDTHTARAQK